MALKHTFQSAKSDGADATLVQPSNWNADHVVDSAGMLMATSSTVPATPAAGFINLHGKVLAGGALPGFIGPSGLAAALQPFLGRSKVAYWSPAGGTATLTGTFFGMVVPATLGTLTLRAVAATSLFTSIQRVGIVTAATVNSRAMAYGGAAVYLRGNAAMMGGFRAVFRFGASDAATVANANTFVGLVASSGIGSGGVQPSSSLNVVGIGADTGETDLSIMHNDGSGTATKVSLGANFPANTMSTDAYELILFCAPNTSQIGWTVTRINTGDATSGTITTDMPVSTQALLPAFMRGNNSTALAVAIDVIGLYLESDN